MSGARYIWESGKKRRVMHIARLDAVTGHPVGALCGINHPFDRSINAPWAMGRPVCKSCKREAGWA